MSIHCPDCGSIFDDWYDGGEQNDCALLLCPDCGYDFITENDAIEDEYDNAHYQDKAAGNE